jgi:hypothetical protein
MFTSGPRWNEKKVNKEYVQNPNVIYPSKRFDRSSIDVLQPEGRTRSYVAHLLNTVSQLQRVLSLVRH